MTNSKPDKPKYCSICGRPYSGRGHNAQPVNDGRSCDYCHATVVISRRILLATAPKPSTSYDDFLAAHEAEAKRMNAEITNPGGAVTLDFEGLEEPDDIGTAVIRSGGIASKTTAGILESEYEARLRIGGTNDAGYSVLRYCRFTAMNPHLHPQRAS